jgi:hypothetical protein
VAIGSVFTFEPTLHFALGEGSSTYHYEWFLITVGNFPATGSFESLSEERELVLPIEGTFASAGGRFRLLFEITDLNTGLSNRQDFFLNIQRPRHERGWWVLHEREDDFDITILAQFQDSLIVYNNVLDMFGSDLPRIGETPKALYLFSNDAAPHPFRRDGSGFSAMIRTDRATSSIGVNDLSFDPVYNNISAFAQRFGTQGLEPGFNPRAIFPRSGGGPGQVRMFMHHNDNFFFFGMGMLQLMFSQPINRIVDCNEGRPFRVSPFIMSHFGMGSVFFDKDNKRFVRHQGGAGLHMQTPSAYLLYSQRITNPEPLFSWTENIESLLYMSNYNISRGFAIIKDSSLGRYRLIQFYFGGNNTLVQSFQGTFEDNAFIESIKFFAMHPNGSFLYMVTEDNRIFRIVADQALMNNPTEITNVVQPGYNISTFEFISRDGGGRITRQDFLTVGSYNPNGPVGANGRVEMFNVDSGDTGDLETRRHRQGGNYNEDSDAEEFDMIFTGFGRPIDIGHRAY